MKQIITISYYANEKPTVELPAQLQECVEIQFIDLLEQDFLILEHAGVKVYRTFKDEYEGEVQEWADDCFAMERWTNWENGIVFDVSELPEVPEAELPQYQSLYPKSETYQRLAYAIDPGWLTEDGYEEPSEDEE